MHSKVKNEFKKIIFPPLVCQSSRLLWWNEETEYRVGGWGKKSNLKKCKGIDVKETETTSRIIICE